MDAPERLTELSTWLTSQVAQQGARLVGDALGEAGVRRHHFAVLTSLAERGASSQAELGRRLWIDRSDLHAVLGELEARGLVARVRDPRDRRRNVVELTAGGRSELARWDALVQAAQETLLAPLSPAEQRELRALLARVVEHHRG